MSAMWPCYECGAAAMGHCGRVGCSAMAEQIDTKNDLIERAASTLLMGIAFAGTSREEFNNWRGHAQGMIDDIRGAGFKTHPSDDIAAGYPSPQSDSEERT